MSPTDIRFALRMMRRNPGFTATVVITLALGIGANTAIFSFLDAALLNPLPVPNPDELAAFQWRTKEVPKLKGRWSAIPEKPGFRGAQFPLPALEYLVSNCASCSHVFALSGLGAVTLFDRAEASLADGQQVSQAYFPAMQVRPAAGRFFTKDDEGPDAPAVVVLSHRMWQARFGGDPSTIGRTIQLNNKPFAVIGVTPEGFYGPEGFVGSGSTTDLYMPLRPVRGEQRDRSYYWVDIMARLRPGVTRDQAEFSLAPVFHQYASGTLADPGAEVPRLVLQQGGRGISPIPMLIYGKPIYALAAAAGILLLIACTNIASLFTARGFARDREMAIRTSVGASRFQIVRQLITESLILGAIGGAGGVALAITSLPLLVTLLANGNENFSLHVNVNWRVLAAAAFACLLSSVLFGIMPARQAVRRNLANEFAQRGGRSFRPLAIAGAQYALSLTLVAGAGLFLRSLTNLDAVPLGFDPANVLSFSVDAKQAGSLPSFHTDLYTRLNATPGALQVSLSALPMLGERWMPVRITLSGAQQETRQTGGLPLGPFFFRTMRIPIVRGREILETDVRAGRRVAVVNQTFVRAYLNDGEAIGRQVGAVFSLGTKEPVTLEIVGVSQDARDFSRKRDIMPMIYMPFSAVPGEVSEMYYVMRTQADPDALALAARRAVQESDPHVPISAMRTMEAQVARLSYQERMLAMVCGFFAALSLGMACVGLHGVLSHALTRRRQEIAIRMALGGLRWQVMWMFLRQVLIVVVAGTAIGLIMATFAGRLTESSLFGVRANDLLTLAAAGAVVAIFSLFAAFLPVRKATHLDPASSLREL